MFENAEVISTYSRKEAIEDGVLCDISNTSEAKDSGFKVPVCITASVHSLLEVKSKTSCQSYAGHLWDVCWMATNAFKYSKDKTLTKFKVKIGRENHILWLCFNEYEGFTIMKPEDY